MDFDPDAYLADKGGANNDNDATPASSPDAAPVQAAGGGAAFDLDHYLQSFDPDQYLQSKTQPEGFVTRVARRVANDAIPAAAGYEGAGAGAEAGAAIGTAVMPGIGTIAGGLIGGALGAAGAGYAASKLQQAGKEAVGLDDSTQLAANAEAHPAETFGVDLATNLAGMRPDKAATLLQRGAGAVMGGGMEAGQEYANDGSIDPLKVATTAGAFAMLPSTNRLGAKLEGGGRNLAGKVIPGRPNVAANPDAAPSQDEAATSQQATVTGDTALEQPAPAATGETTGNPQSAPTRSDRVYGKGQKPADYQNDMLTQGDYDPATAAALLDQLEGGSQYNPTAAGSGMVSPGEQLPVKTGFPEPATEASVPPAQPAQPPTDINATGAKTQVEPQPQQAPPAASGAPGKLTPEERQARVDAIRAKTPLVKRNAGGLPPGHKAVANNMAMDEKGNIYGPLDPMKPASLTPEHEIHPEAAAASEAAKDAHPEPTPGQKEAENYKMGHSRMFGRAVSLENAKGSTRTAKDGSWKVENLPYDYGKFLGTKGADGDHIDLMNVGTGDKHFIVDQRNADTGKFDEHKVIAYAKDANDAVDHYNRGFSDDRGPERLGSIKEVSADDLKAWLAKPGKKKVPFDPNFKEGADAGPVEGTKPAPKAVTATVTKMQERGVSPAEIEAFKAKPIGEQLAIGQKYLRDFKSEGRQSRPDRMPDKVPTVEGLTVTAKDKASAEGKGRNIKVLNDAFEAHKPPPTPQPGANGGPPLEGETNAETIARTRKFLEAAKAADFRMKGANRPYRPAADDHAPTRLEKDARKLLMAKNPTQKSVDAYRAQELLLHSGDPDAIREARNTGRIDSDVKLSKRSGDAAIANAEAQQAQRFETPHEEAETMVEPEKAETTEDVKRLSPKEQTFDVEKPSEREKLNTLMNKLGIPKSEQKARGGVVGSSKSGVAIEEGSTPDAPKASTVRKIDVGGVDQKALLDAVARAKNKNVGPADDEGLMKALTTSKSETLAALGDRFLADNGGWVDPHKIMADLRAGASKAALAILGKPGYKAPDSYIARPAKTPQEQYARSLDDRLYEYEKTAQQVDLDAIKRAVDVTAGVKAPGALRRMYDTAEVGKTANLSPQEKALFDQYISPILEASDKLHKEALRLDPTVGPKIANHMYRILKSGLDKDKLLISGHSPDPMETSKYSAVGTRAQGTAKERNFFALEGHNGQRYVISPKDDGSGFTLWHQRKAFTVKDPNFQFKDGGTYQMGPRTLKMGQALTHEIEDNARGDNGRKLEYYHNAALSAIQGFSQLRKQVLGLHLIEAIKADPKFLSYAKAPGGKAPDHYVTTKLGNFKDWKMDPQLAHVLDDFSQPGFGLDSLNRARQISQAITKTIFTLPTKHLWNVGDHWFVERGGKWLNPAAYKDLAQTSAAAIKSVMTQDAYQKKLRLNGAGTMYGGVLTQDAVNNVARALGEAVEKQPSRWDPIARNFGVGPSDMVKAVYKASQHVMWAGNDMFLTQAIMEHERNGMPLDEAIRTVERHIPNYRVPSTLLGTGAGARALQQTLMEPLAFSFGRYHHGMLNSYSNIARGLVSEHRGNRLEAVGHVAALGILAFAVYPVLKAAARMATGDDKTDIPYHGPLSIPGHLYEASRGKEDASSALRATTTMSPALTTALQQLSGNDWRGKPIIERADVNQAAHGSARAAGKVATQEADFLARGLIAPYGTAARAYNAGQNPAAAVRDQVLDLKTPSAAARKYEGNLPRTLQRQEKTREKHPFGPIEDVYNRITR